MRVWLSVVVAISLGGCTKDVPVANDSSLLSEVKRALADRDKRLTSYHLGVFTKQGDAEASHEFFFRAPARSKGVILTPTPMTLGFDGQRFFKISPAEKKFEAYEMKLPFDKAALFLATNFSPFVPEGYRTPLIPSHHVTAKKISHPKGPEAVEVTVTANDEGKELTVVYVLRWPTAELISKRVGATELTVDEDFCDPVLKLCVPKVVSQRENGVVVASTTVRTIELNPELPTDAFTLVAPSGYTSETHELVEAK